jgi:inhibitor of cysteine peptidase
LSLKYEYTPTLNFASILLAHLLRFDADSVVTLNDTMGSHGNHRKSGSIVAYVKRSRAAQAALAIAAVCVIAFAIGLGVGLRPRNSTLWSAAKFQQFTSESEMRAWISRGWDEGFARVWWNPAWSRWRGACNGPIMYAMAEASGTKSASATNDYSGTNNQISGVDEGDTLKTDGTHIYQLVDQESLEKNEFNNTYCEQSLVIAQVYPTTDAKIVSRIVFPYTEQFEAQEILLDVTSNTLVVLGVANWSHVEARIFDITAKSNPVIVRRILLEGDFLASRMINGIVYFVSGFWPGSRYYSWGASYPTDDEWSKSKTLPPKLVPLFFDSSRSSEGFVPVSEVENVGYVSNVYAQQLITVVAFSVRDRSTFAPVGRATAAVKGSIVMVSQYNVFLATSDWTDGAPNTVIARFEIAGAKVAFRSIGQIEGIILNQFSIDEHEGNVRVATTRYGMGWRPLDNAMWVLHSNMSVIGRRDGIAPGEKIYSVRFSGTKAYMVTFVQTDPLFVLNLGDPTQPVVEGELKVPGVSDYLHVASIERGILIGAGRDQVQGSNALTGVKLSTFDVLNVKQPLEISSYSVLPRTKEEYVSSNVQSDHKSFLSAPDPRNFICLPISISNYADFAQSYSGALVVAVSSDWKLSERARISHFDSRYSSNGPFSDYKYGEGIRIRRQLYINELLYTVSNNVIEAHRLSDFSKSMRMIVAQRNTTIDPYELYLY